MDKRLLSLLFMCLIIEGFSGTRKENLRGPKFRSEPQSRVEFSNTAGTELMCGAEGNPTPKVEWQTSEGNQAADVPGLRYQRSTGDGSTLEFPPFARAEYKQQVHDAVYQCVATNECGSVLSREVHIRAVVKQRFTPQVYDEYVTRGNTAVLKCHLPSFAKEHVVVDAWLRSDGHVYKSVLDEQGRGKSYVVLRSGEFLIHDVKEKDADWSYSCQTRHRLTGEMITSESVGKVILTEPHVSTLPRITFSRSQIRAEEGTYAQLPCVAQGNPPPSYKWMKDVAGILRPVEDKNRIFISHGLLIIKRVVKSDGGLYQCIARNSIGERRVETSLVVSATLEVNVIPHKLELNVGQEATFSCNVTGYPLHRITWLRDRHPILALDSTRMRLLSRDVLHISSVRREDKGMYQCFAHNELDSAQGTSELLIADAPPSLITVFPEQRADPGEIVSMKCMAMGNPVPRITWMLDNILVYSTNRISMDHQLVEPNGHVISHLNISDARTDDSGEYVCEASNDVGTASHAARLNVHGPPFVRPMLNSTAISGSEMTLRCPYGGYPIRRIRWFKEELLLPLDPRQRITHSGALTISNVQRLSDEGRYKCEVKNPVGQSASGTTYLSVVVAPEINAVLLPDTLTMDEGSRAKLVCVTTHGDIPLRFQWTKDSQPFLAHGDATVHTYEDSSIITLKKVTAGDRGRYTCIASNSAASANRTLNLVVNVRPQWTVEPRNATVVLSKSVWMDCAATGFPTPTILWKKLIYTADSNAGDFTWVHSSPRAHRFNNGTLTLSEVEEEDAGSYLCQAQNGIGAGLSKIINLRIEIPPRFTEAYRSLVVVEGHNVTLRCVAYGDKPIEITWQRNMTTLDKNHKHKYSVKQTDNESQTELEIRIKNASRSEDTGIFTCTAMSKVGSDQAQRQLTVQGRPDAPTNIRSRNVTSRSFTLKWDIPHDGNSHITGSVLQYKTDKDSSWTSSHTLQLIVSGSETSTTLRGLKPITTYHVRIFAENVIGRGPPSNATNITTLEEAPTEAPLEVQVHSTGAQSMKVTWKPPVESGRNGKILGYFVGYRISASTEPYHFQKVETSESAETHSTYLTGLKPFTQYDVVVRAYNSAGTGPKSPRVVEKTLETAPPTSPILQITSTTMSSISVRWEKENKEKSAITEYTLHYKADGDSEWQQNKLSGTEDSFTLNWLKCGTRYNLYVTASNSLGTGEPSLPVNARTKGSAPMSPKIEAFLTVNSSWVALHLDRWKNMGCPIVGFSIRYRPKQQNSWSSSVEEVEPHKEKYLINSLVPGNDYVVLVTAYSEAGATQGEYHFRTKSESASSAFGKQETDQPFYRNVSLVIPVVVSSLVLVILTFAIAVCLRKQSSDRRRERDLANQKSCSDSLVLNDIGKPIGGMKSSSKASHYAIPGKNPEYAEPYTYNDVPREGSDGLFATIKRCPAGPAYTPSSYKPGGSEHHHQGPAVSSSINHSDIGPQTEQWNSCRKTPG